MLFSKSQLEKGKPRDMGTYRASRRYGVKGPWQGVRMALEQRAANVLHSKRTIAAVKSAFNLMRLTKPARRLFLELIGIEKLRRDRIEVRNKKAEDARNEMLLSKPPGRGRWRMGRMGWSRGRERFGRGKLGRKIGL